MILGKAFVFPFGRIQACIMDLFPILPSYLTYFFRHMKKIKRKEKDMDTIQKDSKRPLYMACSICGKEIMLHEGYDYCQSRRRTMVYWHKSCYRKKREEDDGRGYDIKTVRKDS